MENAKPNGSPETLETQITLDDLDLIVTLLDGVAEGMDKGDEDKALLQDLAQRLADYTDKICSLSEYTTGSDWPENLPLTISCRTRDI